MATQLKERGDTLRVRATGLRPQPPAASSRNSVPIAFNAYTAWERSERERGEAEDLLARALLLIEGNANRLELRGEDVSHLRAFIRDAKGHWL